MVSINTSVKIKDNHPDKTNNLQTSDIRKVTEEMGTNDCLDQNVDHNIGGHQNTIKIYIALIISISAFIFCIILTILFCKWKESIEPVEALNDEQVEPPIVEVEDTQETDFDSGWPIWYIKDGELYFWN